MMCVLRLCVEINGSVSNLESWNSFAQYRHFTITTYRDNFRVVFTVTWWVVGIRRLTRLAAVEDYVGAFDELVILWVLRLCLVVRFFSIFKRKRRSSSSISLKDILKFIFVEYCKVWNLIISRHWAASKL